MDPNQNYSQPTASTPPTPPPAAPEPVAMSVAASSGPSSAPPIILLLVGFLLGVLLSGAGFWIYSANKPASPTVSPTPKVQTSGSSQNADFSNPFATPSGTYQNPFDNGTPSNAGYQNPFSPQ